MKQSIKIVIGIGLGIITITTLVLTTNSGLLQGRIFRKIVPLPAYNESSCYDSDLGRNYEKKGTVKGPAKVRITKSKYTDYCSEGELVEYFCNDNAVESEVVKCDSATCEEGACLPKSIISAESESVHVVEQTCPNIDDPALYSEYNVGYSFENNMTYYDLTCFPDYYYRYNGYFIASTDQPLPIRAKTCGNFSILVAFFNTDENRNLLMQNNSIPQEIKDMVNIDTRVALNELFKMDYENIFDNLWGMSISPNVTFDYRIKIIDDWDNLYSDFVSGNYDLDLNPTDIAYLQEFMGYDAVLFIDDSNLAGSNVRKWPKMHPLFRPADLDSFYIVPLDPEWLSPELFYNEFFRRNFPVFLSEYTEGEYSYYEENGNTYAVAPVYNPRTGEDISQYLTQGWLTILLSGWNDIDKDGVQDCQDDYIQSTPTNVDADWIPDYLDPDLSKNNGPYFWELAD